MLHKIVCLYLYMETPMVFDIPEHFHTIHIHHQGYNYVHQLENQQGVVHVYLSY